MKFDSVNILGVRIDRVTPSQAVEQVVGWVGDGSKSKRYIATPNIEFIMLAQKDESFRKVLNKADLCIPDSARIGWAARVLEEKSLFKRLLLLPFCLVPTAGARWGTPLAATPSSHNTFPVTTGTDLIYLICEAFSNKGFTVGFLGGREGVAEKAVECLKKLYPGLKVELVEDGPMVDEMGNIVKDNSEILRITQNTGVSEYQSIRVSENSDMLIFRSSDLSGPLRRSFSEASSPSPSESFRTSTIDILFVAFGQGKQEKWITKNLERLPVKVAMGVGGAFDYIGGFVPRAPLWTRRLGMEWFFRLIIQPWRIKRQVQLVRFVWKILTN